MPTIIGRSGTKRRWWYLSNESLGLTLHIHMGQHSHKSATPAHANIAEVQRRGQITTLESALTMNVGSAILWSIVALVGGGMAGYIFGFWEARPTIDALAIVGAIAVVLVAITAAAMVRAFLRSRSLHVSLNHMSVDAKVGLVWSAVAIVASINIGAFLGFTIGLRTAQSVTDALSRVGIAAMVVAIAAALIGVISTWRFRYRLGRRD